MRCNRKTACFAVTPRKKVVEGLKYYRDFAATPQGKALYN